MKSSCRVVTRPVRSKPGAADELQRSLSCRYSHLFLLLTKNTYASTLLCCHAAPEWCCDEYIASWALYSTLLRQVETIGLRKSSFVYNMTVLGDWCCRAKLRELSYAKCTVFCETINYVKILFLRYNFKIESFAEYLLSFTVPIVLKNRVSM